jgi:hypothetical protein
MSDAAQLCGGRSTSLGERYASVYKTDDPDRSLHYEYSSATPEPQRPCRIDFWTPSYRVTGTFPKHAVAGDPVFVLIDGVNESITPIERLGEGLTICGFPCHAPTEERVALLANFSTGPWKDDIPLGVYDALPLVCRMPDCEAGRSQAQFPSSSLPVTPSTPPTCSSRSMLQYECYQSLLGCNEWLALPVLYSPPFAPPSPTYALLRFAGATLRAGGGLLRAKLHQL